MRRFPLVPGQRGGQFAQTIVMPPVAPIADCPAGPATAEWKNLKDIATVTLSGNPSILSTYDVATGIYGLHQGVSDYIQFNKWNIAISDADLPIVCRLRVLSGNIDGPDFQQAAVTQEALTRVVTLLDTTLGTTSISTNVNFSILPGSDSILQFVYDSGTGTYPDVTLVVEYIPTST